MKDWREVFKTEIMESHRERFSKLIVYLTVCLTGIPVIHKSIFNSGVFFLLFQKHTHIYSHYTVRSWLDCQYIFLTSLLIIVSCNLFLPSGIFFFSYLIYFHSGSLGNSLHLSVWNVFFFLIILSFSLFNNSYSCGTMLLGSSS